MEFYKLFHKRTNYHSLLEWIDRGFRPEKWERHDKFAKAAARCVLLPIILCNEILKNNKETDHV
jgi:hypothetical protein